ncbi:MAG: hypothetical protein M1837_003670 [Sclerophora amabilis]|nr:MAG: hypothetical protein M1837_003670 [Sclerophora amabilis]
MGDDENNQGGPSWEEKGKGVAQSTPAGPAASTDTHGQPAAHGDSVEDPLASGNSTLEPTGRPKRRRRQRRRGKNSGAGAATSGEASGGSLVAANISEEGGQNELGTTGTSSKPRVTHRAYQTADLNPSESGPSRSVEVAELPATGNASSVADGADPESSSDEDVPPPTIQRTPWHPPFARRPEPPATVTGLGRPTRTRTTVTAGYTLIEEVPIDEPASQVGLAGPSQNRQSVTPSAPPDQSVAKRSAQPPFSPFSRISPFSTTNDRPSGLEGLRNPWGQPPHTPIESPSTQFPRSPSPPVDPVENASLPASTSSAPEISNVTSDTFVPTPIDEPQDDVAGSPSSSSLSEVPEEAIEETIFDLESTESPAGESAEEGTGLTLVDPNPPAGTTSSGEAASEAEEDVEVMDCDGDEYQTTILLDAQREAANSDQEMAGTRSDDELISSPSPSATVPDEAMTGTLDEVVGPSWGSDAPDASDEEMTDAVDEDLPGSGDEPVDVQFSGSLLQSDQYFEFPAFNLQASEFGQTADYADFLTTEFLEEALASDPPTNLDYVQPAVAEGFGAEAPNPSATVPTTEIAASSPREAEAVNSTKFTAQELENQTATARLEEQDRCRQEKAKMAEDSRKREEEFDSELKKKDEELKEREESLNGQIAKEYEARQRAEEEVKEHLSRIRSLTADNQRLQQNADHGGREVERLSQELADAKESIKRSDEVIRNLQRQLTREQTNNHTVSANLERVRSEKQSKEEELASQVAEVENLRSQLADYATLDEHRSENDALVESKKQEFEDLKLQIDLLTHELSVLHNSRAALSDDGDDDDEDDNQQTIPEENDTHTSLEDELSALNSGRDELEGLYQSWETPDEDEDEDEGANQNKAEEVSRPGSTVQDTPSEAVLSTGSQTDLQLVRDGQARSEDAGVQTDEMEQPDIPILRRHARSSGGGESSISAMGRPIRRARGPSWMIRSSLFSNTRRADTNNTDSEAEDSGNEPAVLEEGSGPNRGRLDYPLPGLEPSLTESQKAEILRQHREGIPMEIRKFKDASTQVEWRVPYSNQSTQVEEEIKPPPKSFVRYGGRASSLLARPWLPALQSNLWTFIQYLALFLLMCVWLWHIFDLRREREIWREANELTRTLLIDLRSQHHHGGLHLQSSHWFWRVIWGSTPRWADSLAFHLGNLLELDRGLTG